MDAIRTKVVEAIDGPGVQSITAGFFGVVAHLDICATALAIIVLSIQVAVGIHKKRTAAYLEKMAKLDYKHKKECLGKEVTHG